MNQTNNYQLCQWDSDDRILRTDFNADNAKTDAAIAAVESAILCVKLVDYTAPAETSWIDVNVSHIDFTQYSRIDFCLEHTLSNVSTQPRLLLNGLTSGYARYTSGNKYDSSFLVSFEPPGYSYGVLSGVVEFNAPLPGAAVICLATRSGSVEITYAPVKWEELQQLNIVCSNGGTFSAGTRVIVTGVKK